jgi:5'-nucleotidase
LRVYEEEKGIYVVDGTPSDCVYLTYYGSFFPEKPEVVLSGINHGGNLGDDILYSGTVAAAMEGALLGLKACAFSYLNRYAGYEEMERLKPWVSQIISFLLKVPLPRGSFFNVNFPVGTPKGFRFTRQGKRIYGNLVVEKVDPRGRKYYWIGGDAVDSQPIPGSDISAVEEGWISITPIQCDLTHFSLLNDLLSLGEVVTLPHP